MTAVQPPWASSNDGKTIDPVAATVHHAVEAVVKPVGANQKCPRDGHKGCAYVDTLKKQSDVGRANALLSYSWQYKVASIASALQRWTDRVNRDPKRTYVWICSLCLNQHRVQNKAVSPDELAAEFGPRVLAIGRLLPMLEPWHKPLYLTRAWCLFELYTAIGERAKVDIDVILTEIENENFLKTMTEEGYGCIDDTISLVRSEKATATQIADLNAIRALIQSKPGGFAQLNSTVKQHLQRWFESHGAVRSGLRVITGQKYQNKKAYHTKEKKKNKSARRSSRKIFPIKSDVDQGSHPMNSGDDQDELKVINVNPGFYAANMGNSSHEKSTPAM